MRRAVAHAVDRAAFVNTVYLGAAVQADGPVPPGNRAWHSDKLPRYAHDVARARQLLTEAGLKDVNGDGIFETSTGKPLAIELLTQRGHAIRERGAEVIASDLKDAGLTVNVVPLDLPALVDRLTKGTYDAAYFAVSASDTDPSANLDYWLSSGSFHVWHPKQKTPATPWEAEIDALMQRADRPHRSARAPGALRPRPADHRHRAADDQLRGAVAGDGDQHARRRHRAVGDLPVPAVAR